MTVAGTLDKDGQFQRKPTRRSRSILRRCLLDCWQLRWLPTFTSHVKAVGNAELFVRENERRGLQKEPRTCFT